jgi:glutamine amidotransferase
MSKVTIPGVLFFLALCVAPHGAEACRFWGLIGGEYPADLVPDHLRSGTVSNLETLGGANTDGWGLGYFISPTLGLPLVQPIVHRGGPRANDSNAREYGLSVDEMTLARPRAAIGHVRGASSGHIGVPDPHPFQHEGLLFAHNGTIPEEILIHLLQQDDPGYLQTHPPDWREGYIDSELYFLYLLKYEHQHPGLSRTEAFRRAIRTLSHLADVRLNFVMTEGDTLWALRCAPFDNSDAVQYSPSQIGASSSYWAVASQPLGSHAGVWARIPARTLGVFVPGHAPVFIPIDGADSGDPETHSRLLVGSAQPNPTRGDVTIPVRSTDEGTQARIEVWDVQGRSVWRGGPFSLTRGENSLRWSGRDLEGRSVASGIYFCRIIAGAEIHEEPVRMIR